MSEPQPLPAFAIPTTMTATKPSAPRRVRRGVHLSTAANLVVAVPWFLVSVIVLGAITNLALPGNEMAAWAMLGGFVLSGAFVLVGPTQDVLAILLFRLRRPTLRERQQLEPVWAGVTSAARVKPGAYRLWIQDAHDVNAFAACGHIVAVNRATLDLPSTHLAAILAHELGHHLGGHSWAGLLTLWYSLPARAVARVLRWVTYLLFLFSVGVFSVGLG